MANRVKLDRRGISALLKSAPIDAATKAAAEAVADNVRGMGIKVGDKDGGSSEVPLPVEVYPHTTDRAHVVVALAHAAGEAVQAKHGALTKAAAQAGLDVNGGGS
jgi:hypothetical protein